MESLKRLNYRYQEKNDNVIIFLGLGLYCIVENKDKFVKVHGKFLNWNFLTGFYRLNIEMIPVYLSVWIGVLISMYYIYGLPSFLSDFILIVLFIWQTIWSVFYLIKFYSFKSMLEILLTKN